MVHVQQKAVNVRPKLLQLVAEGIQQNLRAQDVGVARERVGAGVIRIRGACRQTIAK